MANASIEIEAALVEEGRRLARELEEARADLQAINFHLDEYGTGNDALAGEHKGKIRRAAIFCVQDLWAKLTRERGRSRRAEARLSSALAVLREVEWARWGVYGPACPCCGGERERRAIAGDNIRGVTAWSDAGHHPGCRLAALLASSSPLPESGTTHRDDGQGWRFEPPSGDGG